MSITVSELNCLVVSNNLTADHGHCLALCGVNFPRHNRGARFVFRETQLSKAAPRPRSQEPDIISNLVQRSGKGRKDRVKVSKGVIGAQGLEFIGRGFKIDSSYSVQLLAEFRIKSLIGIKSCSNGCSPLS